MASRVRNVFSILSALSTGALGSVSAVFVSPVFDSGEKRGLIFPNSGWLSSLLVPLLNTELSRQSFRYRKRNLLHHKIHNTVTVRTAQQFSI